MTNDTATRWTVKNAAGLYLGRKPGSPSLGWVGPQFASCLSADEAKAGVEQFGGEVASVPTFDANAKVWR